MDTTPDGLMAEIRVLWDSCEPLRKQTTARFNTAGRGLMEAKQIVDRGEVPPDHLVTEIRNALALGIACQKRILEIMCRVVPLTEELSAITSKEHYAECLTHTGVPPLELDKIRRLRDKWHIFEQAFTWAGHRDDNCLVDELTPDVALKLIEIFERER